MFQFVVGPAMNGGAGGSDRRGRPDIGVDLRSISGVGGDDDNSLSILYLPEIRVHISEN